jgi:tRNA-2-methylthio-N6-dimethylallyladenosine synthase
VRTYGCKMNVHDSERIAGLLDEAGSASVADGAQPDVVVFSTVRENADNSSAATSATSSRSRTARPAGHPSTASSSLIDRSSGRSVGYSTHRVEALPRDLDAGAIGATPGSTTGGL